MSSSRVPRPRTTSATPRATPGATSTTSGTARATLSTRTAGAPTLKTKVSAPKLKTTAPSTVRSKTPTTDRAARSPSSPSPSVSPTPSSPKILSVRDQIALKRKEQLKKSTSSRPASNDTWNEDADPLAAPAAEDDILGRLSIRDTVDRAKSSGTVNLASRELTRIPSYLFESHLTLTPKPLENAPPEVVEPEVPSKIKRPGNTTWYEQADLTILKVWDNAIVELQPELSLFGSLKIVDLHKNKLIRLPNSLTDLVFLTNVDLSENELEELPESLSSLPALSSLNVSHNKLKTIPFEIKRAVPSKKMDSFFAPTAERATQPLPALKILHASHNQLKSNSLQLGHFPKDLVEFDLSHNDLGPSGNLLNTLSTLGQLRTVKLTSCGLTDASFRAGSIHFKSLQTLNLGENDGLTEDAVKNSLVERTLEIGPTDSGLRGVLNVVIGKPGPAREAWEVEAEQRFRSRKVSGNPKNTSTFNIGNEPVPTKTPATKSTPAPPATSAPKTVRKSEEPPKEAWELEAEQGLLTEGGKRRARAAAAAAAAAGSAISPKALTKDLAGLPLSGNGNSSGSGEPPSLVQFYDGPHATLTLPKSQPQPRTHNRSFSVITASGPANAMNFVASPPTLPLPSILSQAFANSIRVLIVSSRRMDSSITLPSTGVSSAILPHLEELCMDNCNLASEVPISTENGFNSSNKAPLLETIAALFPSLNTLELSYNDLTTLTGLSTLLTPDAAKKRKGLKSLKLRGNHISSLEPLEELASVWRDGPGIEGWRGEEIDLRDNEIGRLPPILGLLPLDVFLVEGNTFRVPARRVWEKDGTKGLLKWLSERV